MDTPPPSLRSDRSARSLALVSASASRNAQSGRTLSRQRAGEDATVERPGVHHAAFAARHEQAAGERGAGHFEPPLGKWIRAEPHAVPEPLRMARADVLVAGKLNPAAFVVERDVERGEQQHRPAGRSTLLRRAVNRPCCRRVFGPATVPEAESPSPLVSSHSIIALRSGRWMTAGPSSSSDAATLDCGVETTPATRPAGKECGMPDDGSFVIEDYACRQVIHTRRFPRLCRRLNRQGERPREGKRTPAHSAPRKGKGPYMSRAHPCRRPVHPLRRNTFTVIQFCQSRIASQPVRQQKAVIAASRTAGLPIKSALRLITPSSTRAGHQPNEKPPPLSAGGCRQVKDF